MIVKGCRKSCVCAQILMEPSQALEKKIGDIGRMYASEKMWNSGPTIGGFHDQIKELIFLAQAEVYEHVSEACEV